MSTLTKEELVELLSKDVEAFNEQLREDSSVVDLSECDFSHINIKGANFNGCDLNDSIFADVEMCEVSFEDTDLSGANFTHTTLVECNFSGAILNGTDFSYAKIDYCNFADADMAGAIFMCSNLENSDFSSSANLNACRFDEETQWPDYDLLPDDFDASYVTDLSSMQDEEDNNQNDIY